MSILKFISDLLTISDFHFECLIAGLGILIFLPVAYTMCLLYVTFKIESAREEI